MNKFFKLRFQATKAHVDIGVGIVFSLFSIWMLAMGIRSQCAISFGSVGIVTDRLFPYIIMTVSLILSVIILILGLFDNQRDKKAKAEGKEVPMTECSIYVVLLLVLGVFFNMTMKTIGYPLCNTIAMYAVYYMLGGRKVWQGLAVSVGFTVLSYLFFAKYLGVSLALGFGL